MVIMLEHKQSQYPSKNENPFRFVFPADGPDCKLFVGPDQTVVWTDVDALTRVQ